MIEWTELPGKREKFYSSELAGTLEEALPRALEAILAKLTEYTWAAHGDVTVFLEVGVDTGRIIAAIASAQQEGRRPDGCAIRLQGLQDIWYDADDKLGDGRAFWDEVDGTRRRIGQDFLALLRRRGLEVLPKASTLHFVLYGAEPGEIVENVKLF